MTDLHKIDGESSNRNQIILWVFGGNDYFLQSVNSHFQAMDIHSIILQV